VAVVIYEKPESRKISDGPDGKRMPLVFFVGGTMDEDEVYTTILTSGLAPVVVGNMVRVGLSAEHMGGGKWTGTVEYDSRRDASQAVGETPVEPTEPGEDAPLNSSAPGGYNQATLSFDTSGGTTHITQSVATRSATKRGGGAAPDFKGAIGVSRDGVAGCDIFTPKLEFTVSVERAVVTRADVRRFKSLTGKTNRAAWWGFDVDEVLYLGASGQSTSEGKWNVSHKFAAGEHLVNTQLCVGLVVPLVKAWDYMWVAYEEDTDANTIVSIPAAAYVEQVYRQGAFADLGIGG
jgi:hypothetical protein